MREFKGGHGRCKHFREGSGLRGKCIKRSPGWCRLNEDSPMEFGVRQDIHTTNLLCLTGNANCDGYESEVQEIDITL